MIVGEDSPWALSRKFCTLRRHVFVNFVHLPQSRSLSTLLEQMNLFPRADIASCAKYIAQYAAHPLCCQFLTVLSHLLCRLISRHTVAQLTWLRSFEFVPNRLAW